VGYQNNEGYLPICDTVVAALVGLITFSTVKQTNLIELTSTLKSPILVV